MGFWVTDLIKEVTTPKQPAFDVKEYTDARVKCEGMEPLI